MRPREVVGVLCSELRRVGAAPAGRGVTAAQAQAGVCSGETEMRREGAAVEKEERQRRRRRHGLRLRHGGAEAMLATELGAQARRRRYAGASECE